LPHNIATGLVFQLGTILLINDACPRENKPKQISIKIDLCKRQKSRNCYETIVTLKISWFCQSLLASDIKAAINGQQ